MRVQHNGREIDLSWGELFFSGNISLIYEGNKTIDKVKQLFLTVLAIIVNLPLCIPKIIADCSISKKHIKMNLDSIYPSIRHSDGTITQAKPKHPASENYGWATHIRAFLLN